MIIYETIHIPTRGEYQDFIQVQKSFWSCTHVNSCSKIRTTYQSTYFIDDLIPGVIQNPKIMEIQEVQQKLHTKQV